MEKKLTVPRQRKLKKEFPDGQAVGRAFVQFYLDQKIKEKDPEFKPALTAEEMDFLQNMIRTFKDKGKDKDEKLFQPYYSLYKLLRQFVRWIEKYEHVYYHGLFRDLAVIQNPDYDIKIYHLLKSQTPKNEKAIEEAKSQYIQSLAPVVDILIPNWNDLMVPALKKLYSYSLRLDKIQELTKYNLTPLLPNMKHHENEVRKLQGIAKSFRENLEKFISVDSFEVSNDVLKALDDFIQINADTFRLTEEEKKEDIRQITEAINAIKEVIESNSEAKHHGKI
ncbi:MAG: hypothetical protein IJ859_03185 [Synergistaceae bacterium]|nr:hypothetical protein [Synergistaceae bacterium]